MTACPDADSDGFLPPHGGYKNLKSYSKTVIIYDGTVLFCRRFLDRDWRTTDQMVQAARSGKQNIVEGSDASGTSKETEIKLTNVARASLRELLEDYEDFLRTRDLTLWDKNSREALFVRKLGRVRNDDYGTYRGFLETRSSEVVANILICLIHQARYLLGRQISSLEKTFVSEGGIRERMTRARLEFRNKQKTASAEKRPPVK
ncbi:four helix bundle suffix domain-containing protein [Ereboglobus luteus]|uniref:Four helix bundle protein n=1 Tax=Ereboglobus luteus TaxID=1796921 RepID=A0A2U8E0J2_9BACT|nr:four helix bundle protein [Ereboglobus luteus]